MSEDEASARSKPRPPWFTYALVATAASLLVALVTGAHLAWIFTNWGLCLAWMVPLAVVHELAHALAARALGGRVHGIELGRGAPRCETRLFGFPVTWRSPSEQGVIWFSCGDLRHTRRDEWWITAAGPGIQALLALLPFLVVDGFSPLVGLFRPEPAFLAAFCMANVMGVIADLIPHASPVDGEADSDGHTLLTLPFRSADEVRRDFLQDHVAWGNHHLAHGREAAARAVFEDLARAAGGDLEVGEIAAAHLALLDVLAGGPDDLARARSRLEALSSERPEVLGARGALLVARGDTAEGAQLLHRAGGEVEGEGLWAVYVGFAAIAAADQGWADAFSSHRQAVLDHVPGCPLLRRLEALAGESGTLKSPSSSA